MTTIKKGLKLGKETGSVMNWMMSANNTKPEVGKGATVLHWTDRSVYEVISVSADGKEVILQEYNKHIVKGNEGDGSAEYAYDKLNENKRMLVWRNGAWRWIIKQVVLEERVWGLTHEQAKMLDLFDEHSEFKFVQGITKIKTTFPKVSIIWGRKDEYYDPSF